MTDEEMRAVPPTREAALKELDGHLAHAAVMLAPFPDAYRRIQRATRLVGMLSMADELGRWGKRPLKDAP